MSGGTGTGVQDSLTQHFGLGTATVADRVVVWFPGGTEVVLDSVSPDQRVWVHEDGRTATGPTPPGW